MKKELKFRQDGTFKILQFTDVHWVDGCEADLRTSELMKKILEEETPDLVVFTGDTVYGSHNETVLRRAVQPVNGAEIPWAAVFGNHDAEVGAPKEALLRVQQESPLCLTEAGAPEVSGLGNYNLLIIGAASGRPAWNLYFFDSGCLNTNDRVEGYDYIKRDQIHWYAGLSGKVREQYGEIPALSFLHIPFPEYKEVWDFHTCYGEKNEEVCCPKQNSGLFSAMLEMGDVKGVFVGHDHINDYWGELHGVRLCYGRATGYNTYGKEGFAHGARVIVLKENEPGFETWIRLEDGAVVKNQPAHEPEG